MRVTGNMITYNFLNSLNNSLERQNTIQEQLSDGKAIHKASDDPVKTIRSLRFNVNLDMNEQFKQNVNDACSWMETTDGAIQSLNEIVTRAKELTVQAANSTNSDVAYQALSKEMDGLINSAIEIANTQIGDRYIFSGQLDKTKPFAREGSTDATDKVVYSGDSNYISMKGAAGVVNPSHDGVNVTGTDLFGVNNEFFSKLIEVKQKIAGGDANNKWVSETGLAYIDGIHDTLTKAQTTLGSKMSTYEMMKNMLSNDNVTITKDVAANEDLDVPRAIIDFKTSENVYRTSLSVGARVMPASLVDFLK